MDHIWALEEMSRAVCADRLAEGARNRLATEAAGPHRSVRVVVASALRSLATRLDGTTAPTGERRLARAL